MNSKVRKIIGSDVETKNFNRMLTNFTRIFNTNMVVPESNEHLTQTIISILNEFRKIEKSYTNYCKMEKKIYDNVSNQNLEGVEFADLVYDDPNGYLEEQFENFMIRGEIVLRYRKKLAMIMFPNEDMDDGSNRRKVLNTTLDSRRYYLGEERFHGYKRMLKEDIEWLRKFSDIRSRVEHVENHNLDLSSYHFTNEGGRIGFYQQNIQPEGYRVNQYMNVSFYNLYSYVEDFLAFLINLKCRKPMIIDLKLNEIPSVEGPKWYSIDLKERDFVMNIKGLSI